MSQSYADYVEGYPDACACPTEQGARNHQHNLTGKDVKWVWCYTINHCPSFCNLYVAGEYIGKHRRYAGGQKAYRGAMDSYKGVHRKYGW